MRTFDSHVWQKTEMPLAIVSRMGSGMLNCYTFPNYNSIYIALTLAGIATWELAQSRRKNRNKKRQQPLRPCPTRGQ